MFLFNPQFEICDPQLTEEAGLERVLNTLVSEMKSTYGDNLVALFLYGSAASGDFHEKFSDLNILCVLRKISVDLLKKAEKTVTWFVKRGNPPPLFFTLEEIEQSHDVFPIEFLDMQTNHRLLFGTDILQTLEVERGTHRLELEHELRTKLIGLRQNFLTVSHDVRAVEDLMLRSLSAFVTLFRHILMLMGESVPVLKRDIIQRFCAKSRVDESLFLRLLKAREEGQAMRAAEVEPLFQRYYEEIAKLIQLVDQLPKA